MKINDKEYQCWHEVGHAIACINSGGRVELIELINDADSKGLARARCKTFNQDMRKNTAAGGFAMEYILYKTKRITITEKEFIQEVFINVSLDKIPFFDGNFLQDDGYWPKELDVAFKNHAIKLSNTLLPYLDKIEVIVSKLMEKSKLSGDEVIAIYNS